MVTREEPSVHGSTRHRDRHPLVDRPPRRRRSGRRQPGVARFPNTTAHQAVVDHPGRFGFFANLPIPSDTEAALEELAYALDCSKRPA
jgi:hypothetical protein